MKNNKTSKIVAIVALLAIVIWIIWTWILFMVASSWVQEEWNNQEDNITQGQLDDLIEKYNLSNSWGINTSSWEIDINDLQILDGTWEINEINNTWAVNINTGILDLNNLD